MAEESSVELQSRPMGGTEYSWCKAVPGGTGTTVLALLLKNPPNIQNLQNTLHKIQNSHPILRSKIHLNPTSLTFSLLTPPSPTLQIHSDDDDDRRLRRSLHDVLELEINHPWKYDDGEGDDDVMYASVYELGGEEERRWVVALRLHTAGCDRTGAAGLLRELMVELSGGDGGVEGEFDVGDNGKVNLGIEELVPVGKGNKPFWARGVDLLGYSLNSFRLANIGFVDVVGERCSQVVRLQLGYDETTRILDGCKSREIKLCSVLTAAGLIAAQSLKNLPEGRKEKYAVVTLVDCRSILEPALTANHLGFYHSAILNTHDVGINEDLWELAKRTYTSYTNSKKWNKHFTDMGDLNFLMCKAIDSPGLTPSSSLRTAFISVFEEPVFDNSTEMHGILGVEDYIGCASVHGVGPSIALFDTVRNGCLDCACVYPSPLHSREQINELVETMKKILADAGNVSEGESQT